MVLLNKNKTKLQVNNKRKINSSNDKKKFYKGIGEIVGGIGLIIAGGMIIHKNK